MAINFNVKYFLDSDFEISNRDDNFLYIDYKNAIWLRTNSTGKEILDLCNGNLSLDEVINTVAEKHSFTPDILKVYFSDFLKQALDNNLLLESNSNKQIIEVKYSAYPEDIWIHVTGTCNLKCPFCYSISDAVNNKDLDHEKVIEFLQQIPEENRINIIISGGEPFLYKQLPEFIQNLKALKFQKIVLITNGTVGEEAYERVLPNINTLQISVDGTTPEFHDKTRGQGSFVKMLEKIKLAKKIGVQKLLISFTPTSFNISDLPNLPKFVFENNIDAIHITRLMPVGRGQSSIKDLSPSVEVYRDYVGKFLVNYDKLNSNIYYIRETEQMFIDENDKRKFVELTFASDQASKVAIRDKRVNCGVGCGLLSINYDGNIYPCPSLHHDEFKLGSVISDTYEATFESGLAFAKSCGVDVESSGCFDCKMKYFCGGGCRACALSNGSITSDDPMCNYYKESIIGNMWKFNANKSMV
ncbi:MAG TPA: radical SAM protein [Pseudobacteroides sp.]|uniref:radical SAM/SPASM domain-containing protein n=1 Tax=Pseudobacteroides sp. TaxID=1968840 RepID=UPI002F932C27